MNKGNIQAVRDLAVPIGDIRDRISEIQDTYPKRGTYMDRVVGTNMMQMGNGNEMVVLGSPIDTQPLRLTAHKQLASKMKIPWTYYSRMMKEGNRILAENVNYWLRDTWEQDKNYLLRYDRHGEHPAIRAILSDRYKRIDHVEVASRLIPVLDEGGYEIKSAYVNHEIMEIKAVTPRINTDVAGDVVQGGVTIRNSEVGLNAFKVSAFVYTLVCTNGMIAPVGSETFNRIHLGGVIDANFPSYKTNWDLLSDASAYLGNNKWEEGFNRTVRALRDAEFVEIRSIDGSAEYLNKVDPSVTLTQSEIDYVKFNFRDQHAPTLYGLANAITRTAQDVEAYTRSSELEKFGGTVLNLSGQALNNLVTAEPVEVA